MTDEERKEIRMRWGIVKIPDKNEYESCFGVGPLPGRKRVALYYKNPNVIEPWAYFLNETYAQYFLDFLDSIITKKGV